MIVDPERVATFAALLLAVPVGFVAGTSAAAGLFALAGRSLLAAPPDSLELLLVVGPLLGLLPVSAFGLLAARSRLVARRAPLALGIWLLTAVASAAWLGLSTLRP